MVPSESRVSPATSPKTSGTTTASTRGLWRVDRIVPPGRQFFFVTCVLDNGDRTILISRQWAHQDIQCVPDTQDDTGEVTYRIVNSLVDSTAAPGDSPKRSKPKNKQSKQKKSKIGGSTKKVGRRAHGNSSAGASVATIGDVETLTVNYYDVLVRLPQQPLTLGRCVPRPGPIVDVEAWSLKKSVFVPRLKESDSRSFYNTPGLMRQAFKHDWKMSNIPAFVTDVYVMALSVVPSICRSCPVMLVTSNFLFVLLIASQERADAGVEDHEGAIFPTDGYLLLLRWSRHGFQRRGAGPPTTRVVARSFGNLRASVCVLFLVVPDSNYHVNTCVICRALPRQCTSGHG